MVDSVHPFSNNDLGMDMPLETLVDLSPEEQIAVTETAKKLVNNRVLQNIFLSAISEGELYFDSLKQKLSYESIKDFTDRNYHLLLNALKGDEVAQANVYYNLENSNALALFTAITYIVVSYLIMSGAINSFRASAENIKSGSLKINSPYSIQIDSDGKTIELVPQGEEGQVWTGNYFDNMDREYGFLNQRVYMDNVKIVPTPENHSKYKISFRVYRIDIDVIIDSQINDVDDIAASINRALQAKNINLATVIKRRNSVSAFYPEQILFILATPPNYDPVNVIFSLIKDRGYGDDPEEIDRIGEEKYKSYFINKFLDPTGTPDINSVLPVEVKFP